MNVALLDLYTSGHHIPYASRVKRALETVSDHDVTFLTLSETDQCAERFGTEEVRYLDDPDAPPIEEREASFANVAESTLSAFCTGDHADRYDVVHFLYVDDVLGPLWRHLPSDGDTCYVGELNGVFFHRGTVLRRQYLHEPFLRLLGSPVGPAVDAVVPDRTDHEALWQDLYLYRCLADATFDRVVVHSLEASDYLSRLGEHPGSVVEIPYPAPVGFGADLSREEARRQLGLTTEGPVLLFFGSMKREKGIDLLLDAVRQYDGPPFTLLLAGPPVSIDERDVERIDRQSRVDIAHEFGFISQPEPYFRAADAVVLPYRRQYGPERASQLFEEACSAIRPVVVPDTGVFGRLTGEWNLGATYEQGSVESLAALLSRFASDGVPFSAERMREYSRTHSYEQAAERLCDIYERNVPSSPARPVE